jgi:non-heme chloroperoxidase
MQNVEVSRAGESEQVTIHYQDYGAGKPVVLIHGWPLSLDMWEYQVTSLVEAGFRVIAYDRRGFGRSSKPFGGYDYDTLTDDLKELLDHLDLRDVTLVGFSMGGGEVVRYFSRHGGNRVSEIVLISAVTPMMVQTAEHPDGVKESVFEEMISNIKDDRIAFLESFGKQFFGINLVSKPVSTPLLDYYRILASMASPRATVECVKSFAYTDFRQDVLAVNVPALIIHGDADKTVPIEGTGELTSDLMPDAVYLRYSGAPHGLFYTEREKLNQDLIQFIRSGVMVGASGVEA